MPRISMHIFVLMIFLSALPLASFAAEASVLFLETTTPQELTALNETQQQILDELEITINSNDLEATQSNIRAYLQLIYDNPHYQNDAYYHPLNTLLRQNHAINALLFLDSEIDQNRHFFDQMDYLNLKGFVIFSIAATANYEQLYYRLSPIMDEIKDYKSTNRDSDLIILTLHYAYAQGLFRLGYYDTAAFHYKQALALINRHSEFDNRKPVINLLIGELYVNLHAPDLALSYLRQAIVHFPRDRTDGRIYVRTLLAAVHLQSGQVDLGEEILTNVIFLNNAPRKDYLLYNYQIRTHLRLIQKDFKGAKILTDAALKDASTIQSIYYSCVFQMLKIYIEFQASPNEADIAEFDKLLQELPSTDNSYALYYLSLKKKMFLELGNDQKAQETDAEIKKIEARLSDMVQKVTAELSMP